MISIRITQIIACLNNFLTVYQEVKIVHVFNFQQNLNYPLVRLQLKENMMGNEKFHQKPDMYITNITNNSLEAHLSNLERRLDFNPRAKFVFIGSNIDEDSLRVFYQFFIINVIFIREYDGYIYTYFPFEGKKYPADHFTLVKIGDVTMCNEKNFFENKIPTVWQKSVLTSCFLFAPPYFITENEGLSPQILKYLLVKSDIELEWVDDGILMNEDWILHFQINLKVGKCDSYMTYLVENVDTLTTHGFDDAYWYVPSPEKLDKWKYVFRIFTVNVWVLWIGTPVLISAVWCATICLQGETIDTERFIGSAAFITRFFLEQPVGLFPELYSQKLVAITMIFFTYFMNLHFKSRFAHLLTFGHISESNTLESFEDIMEAKMLVGIIPNAMFRYDNDQKAQKYFKTYRKMCFLDGNCMRRTAHQRDMATVTVNMMYIYDKKNLVDEDGRDLVLRLQPPIVAFRANMILKKGHPMVEFLDRKMHLLWDHGFIDKVRSTVEDDERYAQANFVAAALDIEEIEFPLGILTIGLLVSSIVFYFELRED